MYLLLLLMNVLFLLSTAFAQLSQLSPSLQAIMFKKIFSYSRTLSGSDKTKVTVVYDQSSEESKDAVLKAFQKESIPVRAVPVESLAGAIKSSTVVYIMPGAYSPAIKNLCRTNKVLSITGSPSYVERGEASISVAKENGRPKVIINLEQLRGEEQEMSPELINLARIVH